MQAPSTRGGGNECRLPPPEGEGMNAGSIPQRGGNECRLNPPEGEGMNAGSLPLWGRGGGGARVRKRLQHAPDNDAATRMTTSARDYPTQDPSTSPVSTPTSLTLPATAEASATAAVPVQALGLSDSDAW